MARERKSESACMRKRVRVREKGRDESQHRRHTHSKITQAAVSCAS